MKFDLTNGPYKQRTIDALKETDRLIAKEMRYSPQFRKEEELQILHKHREKLISALQDGFLIVA